MTSISINTQDQVVSSLSNAQIALLVAPTSTFAQFQANLITQANGIIESIINQIIPTKTQQVGYNNIATLLNGSGTAPNPNSPYYATFISFANLFGMDANTFANLVVLLQNSSMQLSILENVISAQTVQAVTNA